MIEQVKNNSYKLDIDTDNTIDIGSIESEFKPILRFNKWKAESFVELGLIGGGSVSFASSTIIDGKVTADHTIFKLEYTMAAANKEFNDLGGLDLKITLKSKPSISTIGFTYNKQSAVAYEQPALTVEYKTGWSDEFGCDIIVTETEVRRKDNNKLLIDRPEYVVNSIAFYHETKGFINRKGESYKTGKIGHLYRMKVTDAIGGESWADWKFSANKTQIQLELDNKFLNTATYPVLIAPYGDTFGYTTAGATSYYPDTNYWQGSLFTSPATTGTVDRMSLYVHCYDGSTELMKGLIHTHSDMAIISNGISNELDTPVDWGWYDVTFPVPPVIAISTDYVLACVAYAYNAIKYDTGDADQGHWETDNNYTTPATPSGYTSDTKKFSIHVDYTPSVSAPVKTRHQIIMAG